MHTELTILLLLFPLAGAVVTAFVPGRLARTWALIVSLATLLVGAIIGLQFNCSAAAPTSQFEFQGASIAAIGTSIHLGIDAISLWLVLLTVVLMPLALAASWETIQDRPREYYAWMLVLLAAMLGVFIARDVLVFYVFFELTLVPMFFIIGIWGGPERRFAAGKFFLFTFTGSVFTLAGAVYLGMRAHTFDMGAGGIIDFAQHSLTAPQRYWVLLAFIAGFAVKVPLFPVHTWLPLAHTEAPTAGSVILAGVLLKLGTYGLLRLAVPIGLIDATHGIIVSITLIRCIAMLCIVGIIYGALVAWVQQDIKKLVAYSSVSHLGFCVLGLISLNVVCIQGSVLYMINHGRSNGALFLVIGMIYDRYHTRDINRLSGLAKRMPILAFFFVLFSLSSIGLPSLNGFVSEFLTILGAFTSAYLGVKFGTFAALGIILGAIYMLHMVARVIWGPLRAEVVHAGHGESAEGDHAAAHEPPPGDIGPREIAILIPLALLVILLGVYPNIVLRSLQKPVDDLRAPFAQGEQMILPAMEKPAALPPERLAMDAPDRH